MQSEEKTIEEIVLAEDAIAAVTPDGLVNYSISDRLTILLPQRFLDPITGSILVLPVKLDNGLTYEAVNAIQFFTAENWSDNNDWQVHSKEMSFNEELYNEIRSCFEVILTSSTFSADQVREYEEKIITTYAVGLTKENPIVGNVLRWCDENNLEIENISLLPEFYSLEVEPEKINFHLVMNIPHEVYDISCCSYENLVKLSRKLYTAPVMGFIASIYSVVDVPEQTWAFTYSSAIGFMLGTGARVVLRDWVASACFVGTMSAATAAAVTALKYVLNTENVLIIGAGVTIGVPLLVYGVERLSGKFTACNRFSLWRAVPPTPESRSSQSLPDHEIEMVPRPL
jgi:hypothetical protein